MSLRLMFLLVVAGAPARAQPAYEKAIVDEWTARAVADPRIKGRFLDVDLERMKARLVELLGRRPPDEVGAAHAGMQIVDEEFQAMMEDLDAALKQLKVKDGAELLARLRALAPQIVHPPPPQPVDNDLLEKARQLASMLRNVGKVKQGELLELAITARVRGQRSYADHLFTLAELQMKPNALAVIAPLFRSGGPPRVTSPTASPPPAAHYIVAIRDGRLSPEVLTVPVGSTVWFANADSIFHNFYSTSPPKPFDLGLYQGGQARSLKFDKAGVVQVSCSLHPHTVAYVIVGDGKAPAKPVGQVTDKFGIPIR
jgi:plastocyanin